MKDHRSSDMDMVSAVILLSCCDKIPKQIIEENPYFGLPFLWDKGHSGRQTWQHMTEAMTEAGSGNLTFPQKIGSRETAD